MPFMTHKEHGATHVGSGEVEAHEKNGWKIDTYENWLAPKLKKQEVKSEEVIEVEKVVEVEVIEEEQASISLKKKPGRKPKG